MYVMYMYRVESNFSLGGNTSNRVLLSGWVRVRAGLLSTSWQFQPATRLQIEPVRHRKSFKHTAVPVHNYRYRWHTYINLLLESYIIRDCSAGWNYWVLSSVHFSTRGTTNSTPQWSLKWVKGVMSCCGNFSSLFNIASTLNDTEDHLYPFL